MATILYKQKEDGTFESCIVDALRVHDLLENGWSVTSEIIRTELTKNENKKVSPKEIRELAKNAGITGYNNLRISTLKEKLGYE